jgi:hypothetical protein
MLQVQDRMEIRELLQLQHLLEVVLEEVAVAQEPVPALMVEPVEPEELMVEVVAVVVAFFLPHVERVEQEALVGMVWWL